MASSSALAGGVEHRLDVKPALARHEAEIEAGNAPSSRVKHVEAVPGEIGFECADSDCGLGGERQHRRSVGTGQRPLADDQHRPLGVCELLQEWMRAVGDLG